MTDIYDKKGIPQLRKYLIEQRCPTYETQLKHLYKISEKKLLCKN